MCPWTYRGYYFVMCFFFFSQAYWCQHWQQTKSSAVCICILVSHSCRPPAPTNRMQTCLFFSISDNKLCISNYFELYCLMKVLVSFHLGTCRHFACKGRHSWSQRAPGRRTEFAARVSAVDKHTVSSSSPPRRKQSTEKEVHQVNLVLCSTNNVKCFCDKPWEDVLFNLLSLNLKAGWTKSKWLLLWS